MQPEEPLRSRDAVLNYIKSELQVFYDSGKISRTQYVDICKSVLYHTMNQPYSEWTQKKVWDSVTQRLHECTHPVSSAAAAAAAANVAAAHAAAAASTPQQAAPNRPIGYSPQPQPHRMTATTSTAAAVVVPPSSATALLIASFLSSVEMSARCAIVEGEESQRQALALMKHSAAKELTLFSTVLALVHQMQFQQNQQQMSGLDNNGGIPMSLLQEQQVALRQLLSQQQQQHAMPSSTPRPSSAGRNNNTIPTPMRRTNGSTTTPVHRHRTTSPRPHGATAMLGTPASFVAGGAAVSKAEVVEFMRQLLQPSYNAGVLPAEQFAEIVREVSVALFRDNIARQSVNWKAWIRDRIKHILIQQQK